MGPTKYVSVTPELLPNLLKAVELLIQTHENESNHGIFKGLGPSRIKRINVAKDYSIAAKKCIVSHRFVAAAELLDIVCQQPTMDPIFFFKATSIFLENNSLTTEDDFFKFTCHIHGLKDISKYEIVLEYLIHSLRKNDLEGYSTLESVVFGQRLHAARNFIVDPLLKAYLGLLHYLKWAKNEGQETSENSQESSLKIIATFKEAIQSPGQWDIFVLKLIEMLESCNKYDEIESVLNKYAEMNPEHINSLIYLCDYFNKYQYSSERHLESLKKLSKSCPSDPRVLTLAELISTENPKKAFKILFLFLDYPCNTKSLRAWKLLSKLLYECLEKSALKKIECSWMEQRSYLWNFIHFSNHALNVNNKTSGKLAVNKSIVLCILEDSSHPFVGAVYQFLEEISQPLFEKFKNKVSVINIMKNGRIAKELS